MRLTTLYRMMSRPTLPSKTGGYIVCVSVEKNLILPKLIVEFSSVLDFLIMNPLFVLVPSIHSDT